MSYIVLIITQTDVLDFTGFFDFYFSGIHQHRLQPVQFLHAIPDPLNGPHLPAPFTPNTFGHCSSYSEQLIT